MNREITSTINNADQIRSPQEKPSVAINTALENMVQAMEEYAAGEISYSQLGSIMETNGKIINEYPGFYTNSQQPPERLATINQIIAELNVSPPPSADDMGPMIGWLQHFSAFPPLVAVNPNAAAKNDLNTMQELIEAYKSGSISLDGFIVKMNALYTDCNFRMSEAVGTSAAAVRLDYDIFGTPGQPADPSPLRSIMADPEKLQAFINDITAVDNAIPK